MDPNFPVSDDLGLQSARKHMSRNVVAAYANTSIANAIKMMQAHKVSGLAVVDAQNKILGSYSEWDALLQGASHDLEEEITYQSSPITVKEDTPFRAVVAKLIKHRVKRIFVVDAQGYLLGLLTRSDVLRILHEDYVREKKIS